MSDIRIKTSFRLHPKRAKLRKRLGPAGEIAVLDLWLSVAENRPTGILDGWNPEDIALAAGWADDPAKLVNTLVELGFLDRNEGGGFAVHGWAEHQPYVAHRDERSDAARKAAEVRWRGKGYSANNAERMQSACDEHAVRMHAAQKGNAPSPSPTPNANTLLSVDTDTRAPVDYEPVVRRWNEIAGKYGFARVEKLTDKRRKKIKARLSEGMTMDAAAAAIDNAGKFLKAGSWFAFDWLMENADNWVKLTEGKYRDHDTAPQGDIQA